MLKVIRTPTDHAEALARLDRLMAFRPAVGSNDSQELELIGLLIEEYEKRAFPIELPDPIDAIKARMDQEGLSQRDLIPMLGSRSKVSEVLARRRKLTLPMIRALHSSLGIPAPVLLREGNPELLEPSTIEWERFPLAEIVAYRWIEAARDALRDPEAVMRRFLVSSEHSLTPSALFRRTRSLRSARAMDEYAVVAWLARVTARAQSMGVSRAFSAGAITLGSMHDVARLSWAESGPRLAVEFLAKLGIAVVVERHLSRTHIDGAAFLLPSGQAVVAVTLRHDRLDNFWYSLMHELAHLSLHLRDGSTTYVDDLDSADDGQRVELEADELAREALIPSDEWRQSAASRLRSPDAAIQLAEKLQINPAIVAGRVRYEHNNYRLLGHLVGAGQVRRKFPEVYWE